MQIPDNVKVNKNVKLRMALFASNNSSRLCYIMTSRYYLYNFSLAPPAVEVDLTELRWLGVYINPSVSIEKQLV